MYLRVLTLLAVVAGMLLLPGMAGATLIWDTVSDGAAITDGSGNWDYVSSLWNSGSGNTTWSNTQVAQFGTATSTGTPGAVTLTTDVTATGLILQKSYTLQPSSFEVLTLSGTAPEIAFPAGTAQKTAAVITSSLTVTDGDAGTADNLVIRGPYATPGGADDYVKFDFGGTSYTGIVTCTGQMQIRDGAVVSLWGTSAISAAGTGVDVGLGSTLRLLAAGDYGAGKTLYLNGYGFGTGNTLHASRAAFMLSAADGASNWLGAIVLNGDSSIAPTGAGDATLSGVISGGGKLVKTSNKALILTASNTYTGDTEIRRGGLTLDSATGPAINKDGGNLVFRANLGNDAGVIKINRDEQIGDGAEIQFLYTGSTVGYQAINLQGHTETVKGLTKSTTKLDSAYVQNEGAAFEGSTGKLIVDTAGSDFSFNGVIRDGSDLTVGTLSLDKKGLGTQTLAGPCTYTGPTSVQGGTLAVNGSITSAVEVQAAGTLRGAGTITGNVDVNGTLGAFYNGDTDTADLLTVVGQLDLTGSTISLSNAGSGNLAGGTYVIAAYSSLVGNPATEVGLLPGWSLDYECDYSGGTDNSIALIVPSVQIPGDANGDGKVNDTDATTVAKNWGAGGATWAMGDFNDDHVVNAADVSILAANWHYGVSEGTGGAVPEPGFVALLVAGGLALLARRWSH